MVDRSLSTWPAGPEGTSAPAWPLSAVVDREGARVARPLSRALAATVSEHRLLIGLVVAFTAISALALALGPGIEPAAMFAHAPVTLAVSLTMAAIAGVLMALAWLTRHRPERPFAALATALRQPGVGSIIFARLLVFAPLITLLFSAFSTMKQAIPSFVPFTYDEAFVSLDAWLHFGSQPWQWLQPLLGRPLVTRALDWCYYAWFTVCFVTFHWQVFSFRRPAVRMQFLLVFALSWMVVGTAMAILFSSAGPAFLADLGLDSRPFDGLIAYLDGLQADGITINARFVQHGLWLAYSTSFDFPYKGISAMPSMHVAIAVLMACLGWRVGRWAGAGFSIFAVLIFLGSIHLGFHYAVDGYVSLAVVVALWLAVAPVARRIVAARAPLSPVERGPGTGC